MKTENPQLIAGFDKVMSIVSKFHFSDFAAAEATIKGMFAGVVLLIDGESDGLYEVACRYYDKYRDEQMQINMDKRDEAAVARQVGFDEKLKAARAIRGL